MVKILYLKLQKVIGGLKTWLHQVSITVLKRNEKKKTFSQKVRFDH